MSTLAEIEDAVETLSGPDKEQLLLFTARAVGAAQSQLPPPRDIPVEQIQSWIAADAQGMRDFLAEK